MIIDETMLWQKICENARHIEVINHELGGVLANIKWLTWAVQSVLFVLCISIALQLINTRLIKKNGNGKANT